MLIEYNENEYKSEIAQITCEYHKKHPFDNNYAGCTCSITHSRIKMTEEEKEREIDKKWNELMEEIFVKYHDVFVELAKH